MNPRDLFFDRIYSLVCDGNDIVIVTPDLAAPSLDKFRKDFPSRYISVGIAEQNLISISCGLALNGKKVVAYGLNPFVVTRCYDQIRNTVSLMNVKIVIAGLHCGLSSAISGPTHVPISDISLMRTLPNITIYNPSHCGLANVIFDQVLNFDRPYYIRFDKDINYYLNADCATFGNGFSIVNNDSNFALVSSGFHSKLCYDISPFLLRNVDLIDIFRIPCNTESLTKVLRKYKVIFVIEEHILQGGLGSYLLEIIADNNLNLNVKRYGIDIYMGYPEFFGNRLYLQNFFNIDHDNLIKNINNYLHP